MFSVCLYMAPNNWNKDMQVKNTQIQEKATDTLFLMLPYSQE